MEPIPEVSDGLTNYERSVMTDRNVICCDPNPKVSRGQILVISVDLKIKTNTEKHKTDEYDITSAEYYDDVEQLVVRRGEPFDMEIQFDRPYDKTKHDVRLVFEFGKDPMPSKGSRVELKPSDSVTPDKWCAVIESNDGTTLKLSVFPPPDCAVAKWSLKIDVVEKGEEDTKTEVFRYKHNDPIYILFNPWCIDDEVCMNTEEPEEDIKEYVMNENGELYKGSYDSIYYIPWEFGQFTGKGLECVMYLLDTVSDLGDLFRGNAVEVSREISSLVNNLDNDGVLVGKWSPKVEDFGDGKKPWEWVASTSILEQYFDTKQPVKYGQCWNFSAVVTTVCRALGIPTRSVSNFSSAHDSDGSITIDRYLSSDDKEIDGLGDSVWNFHVWNECWMARPDLPEGYGGWQAVDATPQERSNGKFQMGPTSVKAIKEGNMNYQYDGPFVFSEVNGDQVTWGPDDEGNLRVVEIDKYSVGKNISTKKRFDKELESSSTDEYCPNRMDITHTYKFEDGSKEEREAVKRASKHSTKPHIFKEDEIEFDVAFKLVINDETNEKKHTFIGETINIVLIMTNKGEEERFLHGIIEVKSTDYRGRYAGTILNRRLHLTSLEPKGEKRVDFDIPVEDYYKQLVDQNFIKTRCTCRVMATHQIFSAHKIIKLLKPNITIKAPEKGRVKESFKAEATFVNPLPFSLTECEIIVEGPGLQIPSTLAQKDVPANGTFVFETEFIPMKSGEKAIILLFNSKELHSIHGQRMIKISK